MNKAEKQEEIDFLTGQFHDATAAYLVGYQGCKCSELTTFRRKLRQSGATFQIVKNTLAKRAVKGTGAIAIEKLLVGPTAVIWAKKDPVSPAKVISEFAKGVENFKLKGGVVEGSQVSAAEIESLARMPSREELLGRLLALMNAPAVRLLQTIKAPASSLARVLEAWRAELEKKG